MPIHPFDEFLRQWQKPIYKWPPPPSQLLERVPLFDFGPHLLARSLPENTRWWQAPMPFPKCWFYCSRPNPTPQSAADSLLEYLVHIEPGADGEMAIHMYGRGNTTKDEPSRRWTNYCTTCHFGGERELFTWNFFEKEGNVDVAGTLDDDSIELGKMGQDTTNLRAEKIEEEMLAAFRATAKRAVYIAVLGAYLLALPKSYQIEEMSLPDLRLRRMRNLPHLPVMHRILHIDWMSARRYASDHHTGVEVAPHDRRAHKRKLYDGRLVDVRASKVKGGSLVPKFYDVRG